MQKKHCHKTQKTFFGFLFPLKPNTNLFLQKLFWFNFKSLCYCTIKQKIAKNQKSSRHQFFHKSRKTAFSVRSILGHFFFKKKSFNTILSFTLLQLYNKNLEKTWVSILHKNLKNLIWVYFDPLWSKHPNTRLFLKQSLNRSI